MKQTITILLSIFLLQSLFSQEFEVREFIADPSDLAARRYEKRTVNDEPCAIVKVITNIQGMRFDSNIGIVDVEHKEEGYWLYIAPRERRIRLLAEGYLAKDVEMPEPAQPHTVYSMIVVTKGMLAPPTDLVRLTFRMNETNVFIRRGETAPVTSIGRNAVFNIEKGEHNFRFIKEGFDEVLLTLDVQEDKVVDVELTPGEVTTPFEPPGFIVVTSEPPGAEVYLNEQRVGITPYQSNHISGQYTLMLKHSDYHDHYDVFELEAGATMTVPQINLKPRFGYWQVESDPPGAEIFLNNRLIGKAPLDKTQISSDYHEVTLKYPLYHDYTGSFTISDGDHKQLNVSLKPAFGGIKITSDPTGANVIIDDRRVGQTLYENTKKASGQYNIRLTKELYADATERITVSDGETTERFIPLAQNFGTLNILATASDIYIDNRRVARENHTVKLTPGAYTVKAVRQQHNDDEREVFVRLGQTENITLTPTPKTGYLSIASEPFEASGAQIWIDGTKQDQKTPAVIPLLEGNYEVRLRKEGFADAVERVRIREGESKNVNIKLMTGKKITFKSVPTNGNLYINNELVGRTPLTKQLGFGRHKVKVLFEEKMAEEMIDVRPEGPSLFEIKILQSISFSSSPDTAEILINNSLVGKTPINQTLLPGNYSVTIRKKNYKTRNKSLRVTPEKDEFRYKLKPSHLMGLGYLFGGSGIKGGMDFFSQGKVHLGLSIIAIDALKPIDYQSYTQRSFAITGGYRIVYPVDFSLYAGWGSRIFQNANDSEDITAYDALILGATLPIYFKPSFGVYIKTDYWTKTESEGILTFSFGIINSVQWSD